MRYTVVVDTDKDIDASLFEVYRDIKKRIRLTKKELPREMSKLDCRCTSNTKYMVK